MAEYMSDPSGFLRGRLKRRDRVAFDMGRAAVGLEIVTQIRTLEDQTVYAVVEVAPIIAALHTLLRDCGIDEQQLYDLYDRLSASRRRGFSPVPSPSDTEPADAELDLRRQYQKTSLPFSRIEDQQGPQFQDQLDAASAALRLPNETLDVPPSPPSEEELRAAYERGKDLGLLDGPSQSGTRSPRKRLRGHRSKS